MCFKVYLTCVNINVHKFYQACQYGLYLNHRASRLPPCSMLAQGYPPCCTSSQRYPPCCMSAHRYSPYCTEFIRSTSTQRYPPFSRQRWVLRQQCLRKPRDALLIARSLSTAYKHRPGMLSLLHRAYSKHASIETSCLLRKLYAQVPVGYIENPGYAMTHVLPDEAIIMHVRGTALNRLPAMGMTC